MKIDSDSAQVKIPPPFVFLFSVFFSLGIRYAADLPIFTSDSVRTFGVLLTFFGAYLIAKPVRILRRNRTNVAPWQPTHTLVHEGPFRFTRNPIYLGFLLIAIAAALSANNWLSLIGPPALFLFLQFYVIPKEEKYLETKFGESYRAFCRTTRRWL